MHLKEMQGEKDRYLQGEPLRIGNRWVLFIDDYFVEDRYNVRREVNIPLKHPLNPVMVGDKPWDSHAYSPSVLFDEEAGLFRMWYQVFDAGAYVRQNRTGGWDADKHGYPYFVCYAESRDGIHWEKPELGLIEYRGWKGTNVVMVGQDKCQAPRVIYNHPSSGQPGKFLLCYRDNYSNARMGLCLAYSDDGIDWRPDPQNPVLVGVRDTQHNIIYDDERERWLLYTRPMSYAGQKKMTEEDAAWGMKSRGAVAIGETPQSFGYARCIMWTEEDEVEKIDAFIVSKCGTHFLGFKAMMEDLEAGGQKLLSAHLTYSRDGLTWQRLPGSGPFIERGPEGAFDAGQVFAPKSIVEVGDHYYIYYSGSPRGQASWENLAGVGIAQVRKNRFIGQVPRESGGYLLTREFVLEGDELHVNMTAFPQIAMARFAAELVRVLDRRGPPETIEGYSFEECDNKAADLLDTEITWGGKNVAALKGQPVQVRFYLKKVGLYALRCVDSEG